MQYTYKTREKAMEAKKYWDTRAKTRIRVNKNKHGNTYTLLITPSR